MRGGKACAAWGLVWSLALAGCSGSDEKAGGPPSSGPPADATSSSTPTTTAETPSGPPQLPAAARDHTTAGAKAFVRYYVAVLNYADLHGTAAPLESAGTEHCRVCRILASAVRRIAADGGAQVGGAWVIRKVDALPHSGNQANILTEIHVQAGSVRQSQGSPADAIRASNASYELQLRWVDDAWLLNDVVQG